MQIRDEQADLAGMDRGQLEAKVIAGARARAAAPRDVSAELRATAQAETDMRIMAAEGAGRRAENAAIYDQAADEMAGRAGGLEAANADVRGMVGLDSRARGTSRSKAQKELERRGYEVPEWTPENEQPRAQADEPEGQVDEPELEADGP